MLIVDPLGLPSIRAWAEGFSKPLSVLEVVSMRGGLEMALVFSKLFLPDFRIVEGVVVLDEMFTSHENLVRWREKTLVSGGRGAWDNVHVYDLFLNETDRYSDDVWLSLAEVLQRSWQAHLDMLFPDSHVTVELTFTDQDYGPTLSIDQTMR